MANYLVTDTELTSVANAIRSKGGTSAALTFPSGFNDAIAAISSGGYENVVTLGSDTTLKLTPIQTYNIAASSSMQVSIVCTNSFFTNKIYLGHRNAVLNLVRQASSEGGYSFHNFRIINITSVAISENQMTMNTYIENDTTSSQFIPTTCYLSLNKFVFFNFS